jgi:acetyltransferase
MHENPLKILMNPSSIAVVGANNNPSKMGTLQALSIIKDGYQGRLYFVHPKEQKVLGHAAYRTVDDLPEVPDVAMFIVPNNQVLPLLEAFGKIGTKRAIVITAGFKETGEEGLALEKRLNEVADAHGMRFLGPNCMGMLNAQAHLNMTVQRLISPPGSLGMASQSGTYVTQTFVYLRKRGIRFSKAISVGNEANIDITDCMEYLGNDEDTKAIVLYIEGISDGRRFIETAQQITPHKPILAQYVGGSKAGARAGKSHTGALAGPDNLYEGIFKQAGIIRLQSVEDLYAHGWTLATQCPLKGKRIAVVTNSGGPSTAISHTLDQGGLEVPQLSDALQAKIRPHIPSYASCVNPIDLTFNLNTDLLAKALPEMLFQSGEVDGLVMHGAMSHGIMREAYYHVIDLLKGMTLDQFLERSNPDLTETATLARRLGKPLVVSAFFDREDNYTRAYEDHDVPVIDAPEKAARAMVSLFRYLEIRNRKAILPPALPKRRKAASEIIRQARHAGRRALDEHDAKRLLNAYGIPVTLGKRVESEKDAVTAAEEIGFPVAVKACSPDILHKTDKGLIALNVQTPAAVREVFHGIWRKGGKIPVLVEEMLKGSRELMAGMTRFPGFGPCVLFGLGGILTEALRDTTFRCAPLSDTEADEMLDDIRSRDILRPFRGMPAARRSSLVKLLQAVSFIPILHPEVTEIDLNPIILDGPKPVVADALIALA